METIWIFEDAATQDTFKSYYVVWKHNWAGSNIESVLIV